MSRSFRSPLAALLVFLSTVPAAHAQSAGVISATERDAAIDGVLTILLKNYVFPEKAEAMEEAVRERAERGEYDEITNGQVLAARLTDDLRVICEDLHLRVLYTAEARPPRPPATAPTPEEREARRAANARRNFGFVRVERLPGNVGYLRLDGFVDVELGRETASAAMNFLAHCDAILVDLRHNGGGSPEMVQWITSYLFDEEPVHLNSLYFRPADETTEYWTNPDVPGTKNPDALVYVLTSGRTFSAAEEFTYNLKCLERAVICGETTGGGAHPGGTRQVDDHFAVWVPSGRAINPISGTNWEGTGVAPDLDVPAWEAYHAAWLDALERLRDGATDPDRRQELLEATRTANRELADLEVEHEG